MSHDGKFQKNCDDQNRTKSYPRGFSPTIDPNDNGEDDGAREEEIEESFESDPFKENSGG